MDQKSVEAAAAQAVADQKAVDASVRQLRDSRLDPYSDIHVATLADVVLDLVDRLDALQLDIATQRELNDSLYADLRVVSRQFAQASATCVNVEVQRTVIDGELTFEQFLETGVDDVAAEPEDASATHGKGVVVPALTFEQAMQQQAAAVSQLIGTGVELTFEQYLETLK